MLMSMCEIVCECMYRVQVHWNAFVIVIVIWSCFHFLTVYRQFADHCNKTFAYVLVNQAYEEARKETVNTNWKILTQPNIKNIYRKRDND